MWLYLCSGNNGGNVKCKGGIIKQQRSSEGSNFCDHCNDEIRKIKDVKQLMKTMYQQVQKLTIDRLLDTSKKY